MSQPEPLPGPKYGKIQNKKKTLIMVDLKATVCQSPFKTPGFATSHRSQPRYVTAQAISDEASAGAPLKAKVDGFDSC